RQRLAAPCSDEPPDCAAGERQQQALGEKLANQARAARRKRHADGDRTPAARRAREQQGRHVCTGNEQPHRDNGQQDEARATAPVPLINDVPKSALTCACIVSGTVMSSASPTCVPKNSGAEMPTIVNGRPFRRTVLPIAPDSPPNCRRQYA